MHSHYCLRTHTAALSVLILLLIAAALALPSRAAASRAALPGGGGYAASTSYRALVTLALPVSGFGEQAGHGAVQAGFLTGTEFGAPGDFTVNAEGAGGAQGSVTLQLDENVDGATLYCRRGGDLPYQIVPMQVVQGNAQQWSGAIPAAYMTARGLQYYIEVEDGPFTLCLPAGAPESGLASFSIDLADYKAFELEEAKRYYFLGTPITPENANPLSVFQAALGGYDPVHWRYGTWNPQTETYAEHPNAAAVNPGQGFWLIADRVVDIDVDGQSADLSEDFTIALAPGWNQIGNPFAFSVPVSALSYSDAIARNLHAYNPNATGDYDDSASGDFTALAPSMGYWVENAGASAVTLSIPASPNGRELRSAPALPKATLADGEAGWSVQVAGTTGRVGDARNRFGQRAGATGEQDAFDYSEPPSAPQGYLSLAFLTAQGKRLYADYRDPASSGERWRLRLSSDQKGASYRVDFNRERSLPADWRLVAIDGTYLSEVDLLATPALAGTVTSGDFERTWHLLAGPAAFVEEARQTIADEFAEGLGSFALWAAYPNPFGATDGTVLALAAPSSAPVELKIFDVQGRLVRTLHEGAVERGVQRFIWRGESENGEPAAAGVYFVRMKAPGVNAVRKVVLLR